MKSSASHRLLFVLVQAAGLMTAHVVQANVEQDGAYFLNSGGAAEDNFQFKPGVQLQTGQQNVNQSGTLFSNNVQRARGANLSDSADRYRLQVFGYEMQSAVRYDGLSFSYLPDKYSSGASLELNDMRQWNVQSGFLTNSQSIDAATSEQQTSTWNVAADRLWMHDSVLTRIEYAQSQNNDYNAVGASGNAVDIRVDTLSLDWIRLPLIDSWDAGVRYRAIGDDYFPAADLALPSGLEESKVYFRPSVKNFTFGLGWREQNQDAVDALALLARSESRAMSSVRYSPNIKKDNTLQRVLGTPSLTAHFHKIDEVRPGFDRSGAVQSLPLQNRIDEHGLTLELAKPAWHWSVQYQESSLHLRSDSPDAVSSKTSIANGDRNSTFVTVGVNPLRRVALSANAEKHRQVSSGELNGNSQQLYNLSANFDVVPDAVSVSMQYNYVQSEGAVFTGSNLNWGARNQIGSAALSWRGIALKGSRPIMDLSLRSSYGRFGDQFALADDKRWSAQLSMNMYLGERM